MGDRSSPVLARSCMLACVPDRVCPSRSRLQMHLAYASNRVCPRRPQWLTPLPHGAQKCLAIHLQIK